MKIAVFVTLGLASLLAPSYAQSLAGCSVADKISECAALNRTCALNTTSNEEFCHHCANGTVPKFSTTDDLTDCIPIEDIDYEEFEKVFEPLYSEDLTNEERHEFLKETAYIVSEHNSQDPPPDFYLEINHLAALTDSEKQARNGAIADPTNEEGIPFLDELEDEATRDLQSLPEKVDWVEGGAVFKVQDQGMCGCCWAIATAEALAGSAAINTDFTFNKPLSFQQFISCEDDQNGCVGGNVPLALNYAMTNDFGGVTTDEAYPFTDYSGTATEECAKNDGSKPLAVTVSDSSFAVSSSNPSDYGERVAAMKKGLVKQPLAVLMNGYCDTFNNYGGGILTDDGDCACADTDCIDHAVLMVGYDDTDSPPSFKIKNSWGTTWGEEGYFRIAQDPQDTSKTKGLFGLLYQGSAGTASTDKGASGGSTPDIGDGPGDPTDVGATEAPASSSGTIITQFAVTAGSLMALIAAM